MMMGKKIILYAPTHRKEGKEPISVEKLFDLAAIQEFCEKKSDSAGSGNAAGKQKAKPAAKDDGFMNIPDGVDDELPFN